MICDRRPNRAFLRSRKSASSIPKKMIGQSDRRSPSKNRLFQRDARIGLLDRKSFSSPPHLSPPQKTHDHTLQQLRRWLDCYCCCCCCCCCSQRVSVAHPIRLPAARYVIRWQQCVLSMTFWQHRCCCCARYGDYQRVTTPQPRR